MCNKYDVKYFYKKEFCYHFNYNLFNYSNIDEALLSYCEEFSNVKNYEEFIKDYWEEVKVIKEEGEEVNFKSLYSYLFNYLLGDSIIKINYWDFNKKREIILDLEDVVEKLLINSNK